MESLNCRDTPPSLKWDRCDVLPPDELLSLIKEPHQNCAPRAETTPRRSLNRAFDNLPPPASPICAMDWMSPAMKYADPADIALDMVPVHFPDYTITPEFREEELRLGRLLEWKAAVVKNLSIQPGHHAAMLPAEILKGVAVHCGMDTVDALFADLYDNFGESLHDSWFETVENKKRCQCFLKHFGPFAPRSCDTHLALLFLCLIRWRVEGHRVWWEFGSTEDWGYYDRCIDHYKRKWHHTFPAKKHAQILAMVNENRYTPAFLYDILLVQHKIISDTGTSFLSSFVADIIQSSL